MNALAELERPIERRPITDRAEWLQWRLQDCTASDVSALFGAHPYGRTRLSLWAEKAGLTVEGMADGPMLRVGRWGEAAVLEMLADERPGWIVSRPRVYLRDPSIRLGATPDAEALDPERDGLGIVQCKMLTEGVFEREWPDGPPLGHQLQTLTEMLLARAAWGAIAALVTERYAWRPVIFELSRHEGAEARIRAAVNRFWADFEAGLMPVLDPERDSETIERIYPKAEVKTPALDLSGDNDLPGMLATRGTLTKLIKDAVKQIDNVETRVKARMGLHERAIAPGWRISWKNEPRKGHTVAPSNPRVLRISED
jgi:predicted phage-related endonuclease